MERTYLAAKQRGGRMLFETEVAWDQIESLLQSLLNKEEQERRKALQLEKLTLGEEE